jgi:hypothetical protein
LRTYCRNSTAASVPKPGPVCTAVRLVNTKGAPPTFALTGCGIIGSGAPRACCALASCPRPRHSSTKHSVICENVSVLLSKINDYWSIIKNFHFRVMLSLPKHLYRTVA